MIVWIGVALALLQGARFNDWPPDGAVGTALIDSVGCRTGYYGPNGEHVNGVRLFEDGYTALTEGNQERAQLLFRRGIAEGSCRRFAAGEQVVRQKPGWFYMNARPTDALPPLALWEAICVRPASEPDADPFDCYYIAADLFQFPK
ncbi:MAG: hypothetical protein OYL41_10995 [Acidobacteriota bacterium]|nr:hypothetical protein [Bryobacterales bacterium]MDE3262494.1 hypothetical protein [Acidobacteriota bacterium]